MKTTKYYYFLMCLLISTSLVLISCQKNNQVEPIDDNVNINDETATTTNSTKCYRNSHHKVYLLTKQTWTYGEVFHNDQAVQEVLAGVFANLEFTY